MTLSEAIKCEIIHQSKNFLSLLHFVVSKNVEHIYLLPTGNLPQNIYIIHAFLNLEMHSF